MDPMDDAGHVILDFSVYDAMLAGFEKVIFIIKKENEAVFKECVGDRIAKRIQVEYAYQELTALPEGFELPEGRQKPFGTGHAVLCCKDKVDGPFAVINADDFYGRHAFEVIYKYLSGEKDGDKYHYVMVGYIMENTLTENGHVARGICEINAQGELVSVTERTRIEKKGQGAAYTEDAGDSWISLPPGTIVSMNMWGFTAGFLTEIEKGFAEFLENGLKENPQKCEYFLPFVVSSLLQEDKACVAVLETADKWYGVTYKEDKPVVEQAVCAMKQAGIYPDRLWGDET